MLKKYDELTKEEKEKVSIMYSDLSTLQQFLYNFDKNGNYHGRQYFVGDTGTIHTESTLPISKVGVTFTPEQEKLIKELSENKPKSKKTSKKK